MFRSPTRTLSSLFVFVLLGTLPAPISAQGAVGRTEAPAELERRLVARYPGSNGAEAVREEFRELLRQHPPALAQILRLDPSLINNPEYLSTYPQVATFIKQRPEIARNPDYFLPSVDAWRWEDQSRSEAIQMWRGVIEGTTVFLVFAAVAGTLFWVVRYFVNHRRWLRAVRIQSEAHNRVMERISGNEELLAYIQSPIGSQLLKGVAVPEPADSQAPAPLARMLWSVQAGAVLAAAGSGLLFAKRYVLDEVAAMMVVFGVVVLSVGVGFVAASVASYALSKRLGLLDTRER